MNGTVRHTSLAALALLLGCNSVRALAGDPISEIAEDEDHQQRASGVHKIIQPAATDTATKIGQALIGAAAGTAIVGGLEGDAGDLQEDRPGSVKIPPSFKPWTIKPEQTEPTLAPDQHHGNANRLRNNMRKAGWECPKGFAAHHIVNKGAPPNSNNPDYKALRDCLDKWQVDIDAAGNGICLPNSAEAVAADPAVPHRGRERDVHGPEVTAYMLGVCEQVESQQEMRDYLDRWRKLLAKGGVPWKVSHLQY